MINWVPNCWSILQSWSYISIIAFKFGFSINFYKISLEEQSSIVSFGNNDSNVVFSYQGTFHYWLALISSHGSYNGHQQFYICLLSLLRNWYLLEWNSIDHFFSHSTRLSRSFCRVSLHLRERKLINKHMHYEQIMLWLI